MVACSRSRENAEWSGGTGVVFSIIRFIMSSESEIESDHFQDSGSEYAPSDLDQPSTSRRLKRTEIKTKKRDRRRLDRTTLTEKRGRKRVRNESARQINVRKSLKACGEEYLNSVKKVVPKRTVGIRCTCRLKCFDKIDETKRLSILSSFNDLGN
ncbi:unnamed protein product [Diabrotica balteata]|uniref:Uncharacterized protein n=1 Tax=Diabrotica balteata TaxID=107213 RepID=A0A9N9T9T6_DIABA|nr:unnamed protein product [Diabrotica balteata]